jgi:hypothetical protein
MAVWDSLHSLLDWECLLFCMTDLVLIYESVSSSASVVRWLTLDNWTLSYDWITELPHEWTGFSFYNSGWTEYRSPSQTVPLLLSVFPLLLNVRSDLLPNNGGRTAVDWVTSVRCLPNRYLAMDIFRHIIFDSVFLRTFSMHLSSPLWVLHISSSQHLWSASISWRFKEKILFTRNSGSDSYVIWISFI